MIALALIESDVKKQWIQPLLIQPLLIDAFEVGCILCHSIKAYSPDEVVAWAGPLPTANFRPDRAFQ
jgi:hypothetical protein